MIEPKTYLTKKLFFAANDSTKKLLNKKSLLAVNDLTKKLNQNNRSSRTRTEPSD